MTVGEYLVGLLAALVCVGSLWLGSYALRRRFAPGWQGTRARLAESVMAVSALTVVAELVGVVGLFRLGWLVLASVLVGLVAWIVCGRPLPGSKSSSPSSLPSPPTAPWALGVAVVVSLLVIVHWAVPTLQAYEVGMYAQDTIWYHMSFSARMAQEAQVGPILFTDPLATASWFYPQNSELHHAIGIVFFGHDLASPIVNLLWLAFGLFAAWCIGRPYGIGWLTVLAAAIIFDTPMMLEQSGNAPNDIGSVALLLATMAFLVNGEAEARASGSPVRRFAGVGAVPLAFAGLAAGLALGTKITLLAAIGALTVILVVRAAKGNRLRTAGIWIGALAIPSAFWYLRNLVLSGNPLPQLASIGPVRIPGPSQLELYPRRPNTIAAYWNDPAAWTDWFGPALADRLGPLWFLILAAMAFGLVYGVLRGRSPIVRILAAVGLVSVLAYLVTPLTASGYPGNPSGFAPNLRYFAPGLVIGLVTLPLALPRPSERTLRIMGASLAAVLLVGTIVQATYDPGPRQRLTQEDLEPRVAKEPEGFTSFKQDTYVSEKLPGALLLGFLIVGLPVLGALGYRSSGGSRRLAIAFGCTALGVGMVAGVGWSTAESYVTKRYDPRLENPFERTAGFRASDRWRALQAYGRKLDGARIGVVGRAAAFGQYVFYGEDLDNRVQYLGRKLLKGTYRPILNCQQLRRALNRGRFTHAVVTPRITQGIFFTPAELRWLTTDPNARQVVAAGPSGFFKIEGPLDPESCPPPTPEELGLLQYEEDRGE